MRNLTAEQKKRLVSFYPELNDWFRRHEAVQSDSASSQFLVALIGKIDSLKGEKGDPGHSPVKGKDYLTEREISDMTSHILKRATPVKGIHYRDGDKGDSYVLTARDKDEIAGKIPVPVVERETRIETVRETMPKSIDVSVVKGAVSRKELDEEKREILGGMAKFDGRVRAIDQRWHGGGLSKVYHDSTLSGDGTSSNPLSTAGGSSGSIIAATDSGDHQDFNLAKTPTTASYYVIMNNGSYTTDDQSFPFSVSGTVLTFVSPLPSDLYGTLIKLVCV